MISMNVEIDSNSDLVIGADIGGSNIRVALVDSSGNLLVRKKIDNKPSLGIEIAGEKISQCRDWLWAPGCIGPLQGTQEGWFSR